MIYIASDHAGINFKKKIIEYFVDSRLLYQNLGTDSRISVDYPHYAKLVAMEVPKDENNRGILICGTGIGMSIVANKFKGIRAALCKNKECARLARKHNNANVLCLGEKMTYEVDLIDIVKAFLYTDFDGERHLRRINQISEIENNYI